MVPAWIPPSTTRSSRASVPRAAPGWVSRLLVVWRARAAATSSPPTAVSNCIYLRSSSAGSLPFFSHSSNRTHTCRRSSQVAIRLPADPRRHELRNPCRDRQVARAPDAEQGARGHLLLLADQDHVH